jgi:hypothetical protein
MEASMQLTGTQDRCAGQAIFSGNVVHDGEDISYVDTPTAQEFELKTGLMIGSAANHGSRSISSFGVETGVSYAALC